MKRKRIVPIPEGLKTLIKRYDDSENERVKEHIREWLDESPLFESEEDEREWRREVDAWTQAVDLTNITFSVIKPERKYRTLDDYDEMSEIGQESSRSYIDDRIIRRDECGAYSSLAGFDTERD